MYHMDKVWVCIRTNFPDTTQWKLTNNEMQKSAYKPSQEGLWTLDIRVRTCKTQVNKLGKEDTYPWRQKTIT